jgi:hypothetical protein
MHRQKPKQSRELRVRKSDAYTGYFLETGDEPRVRRPGDTAQVGLGLVLAGDHGGWKRVTCLWIARWVSGSDWSFRRLVREEDEPGGIILASQVLSPHVP